MTIRELTAFDLEEILPLYSAVGWTSYTDRPEMLKTAWENSLLILGAYDGGRLIGAVRAVGDGASIVYVQDILVLPEYQRRGDRHPAAAYPDGAVPLRPSVGDDDRRHAGNRFLLSVCGPCQGG